MRVFLPLLLVTSLLLGGCAGKGERLYQRAEQFFVQGQFALAAAEYQRVFTEEAQSPLADDAIYKLAYLYREELGDIREAITTYMLLANSYPTSPYADDALLWVLYLHAHDLKDVAAVRQTYELIRKRFARQPEVCARAHLQFARALATAGETTAADTEAQRLLNLYPKQTRQAAAALLLRARLTDKLNRPAAEAVKLYEQIIKTYPNTLSAEEAKRAIGWAYYGERGKQLQAQRQALEKAARVISQVPDIPADQGPPRHGPFVALRSLLAQRGVKVSLEQLLVAAGVAFELHYAPHQPEVTRMRLERGALAAAAEQYGFAVNTWSAASAEASFASLAQSISQGRPVMVPQAEGSRWMIVTGYRPAEDRVYLLPGRNGQPRALSRQQFFSLWARNTRSHTAVVTGPYFQFSLGQQEPAPSAATRLRVLARTAHAALHEAAAGEITSGLAAYDVLTEQLTRMTNATPDDLAQLRKWADSGLPQLAADRRAAATALTGVVDGAAGTYGEVARLSEQLRAMLISLTQPAQGAEPPPEASWPEAIQLVRDLRATDERAAGQLAEAVR